VPDIDKEKVAARLRERADEIAKHLEQTKASDDGELADYDQHPADQGTETLEREMDETRRAVLENEAKDVATAQQRLEEGTYGTCIVDGEEIPAARLEAIPEAIRCIRHQEVYDAQLRAGGGGML
jgi:RNA polymerase-binding transcription factor DksA